MSKYVALYRADAKNSGCIFWMTIFEQETVCGSKLKTLGITVLFKWEQIQRSLHLSSVFLIPRRKKKATPSFGIDPEQPWNAEHLTAPDVYLCVLGRCIQIQTWNLPGLWRTRCHSYRIFFFPGSFLSVSTLCAQAPAVPRGRIIASVFPTLYLISAWAKPDTSSLSVFVSAPSSTKRLGPGCLIFCQRCPSSCLRIWRKDGAQGSSNHASRDSLSFEYKESWLGDNPEVARQAENRWRHCAGVSGWSGAENRVCEAPGFILLTAGASWPAPWGPSAGPFSAHGRCKSHKGCFEVTPSVSSFENFPGRWAAWLAIFRRQK